MSQRRAIVVGAGPGGLAAAIVLQRAGFDVTVCERAPHVSAGGSGLTLWPNATRALDALDLVSALGRISHPITRIAMKNSSGRTLFEDDLRAVNGGGQFPAVALLRQDLVELLARECSHAIVTNAFVTRVQQNAEGVQAQLADRRWLEAELLIGADGLHSAVRAQLAGDLLVEAGYTVWRGIAPFALDQPVGTMWMGAGRQFGVFPLPADRTYWFAARRSPENARHVPADQHCELAEAFSGWPDPVPLALRSTADRVVIRTDIYDRRPLARWTSGRVALLGDAAHPAQPTLGQGACLAIEDAVVLGVCLVRSADIPAALHDYEARRIRRANGFVLEARRMGRLGLWEARWACWLRDQMMGILPATMREKQLARMFDFGVAVS